MHSVEIGILQCFKYAGKYGFDAIIDSIASCLPAFLAFPHSYNPHESAPPSELNPESMMAWQTSKTFFIDGKAGIEHIKLTDPIFLVTDLSSSKTFSALRPLNFSSPCSQKNTLKGTTSRTYEAGEIFVLSYERKIFRIIN